MMSLNAFVYDLYIACRLHEMAEDNRRNCKECEGEGEPEACPQCFPLFVQARVKRKVALAKAEEYSLTLSADPWPNRIHEAKFMTLPTGFHYDVPAHIYHTDPCAEPSLTQSIAKILLSQSPAHARLAHPRLNPDWQPSDPTKYDTGNIAHRLILGRGRELEVLEYDSWRTDASKLARKEAAGSHKLAVLAEDYEVGSEMAQAAFRQLHERGYSPDWDTDDVSPARAEVVIVAEAITNNIPGLFIWLRAMIDWLPSMTRIWDLKTTHMPASRSIQTSLPDWCIQAAMHERILNLIDVDNIGWREHRFVVQEDYPPYALQAVRLTETHLTVGRRQIARAEATWARCVATGQWPAYPLEDQSPEYPGWALAKVMEESDD